MEKASAQIESRRKAATDSIKQQMRSRTYRASNELLNSAKLILRGRRSGRTYRIPYTKKSYRASAPGEAPANRLGTFRESWKTNPHTSDGGTVAHASIESRQRVGGRLLGELLENGHGCTAARPYQQAVKDRALDKIKEIFDQPYGG